MARASPPSRRAGSTTSAFLQQCSESKNSASCVDDDVVTTAYLRRTSLRSLPPRMSITRRVVPCTPVRTMTPPRRATARCPAAAPRNPATSRNSNPDRSTRIPSPRTHRLRAVRGGPPQHGLHEAPAGQVQHHPQPHAARVPADGDAGPVQCMPVLLDHGWKHRPRLRPAGGVGPVLWHNSVTGRVAHR